MFHSDNPISEISDDLLDRGNFANRIAMVISSYTSSECLTIGVYGIWDDGKSSLTNMIISEIKKSAVKDKYAVINFNPRLYSNKEDLIAQMFKEISMAFKISNPSETVNKVADVIEKTGKIADIAKMLPIPIAKDIAGTISEAFGKYSSALKDGVNEEKELPEIKKEIESALEKNKIKLLISIDDFDRLNQEEIRIMFQVVKILGNFKNTIYSLTLRNNESFLINIREIEKYLDITELHNKISNKIKTHLLSKEKKTVVSAFEFYYKNKNDYHIDSNGIVEVLDLMHIGEDEE